MSAGKERTKRFRELVERPEIAVGVGGALPIHARMVEKAGFDFFQIGGTMLTGWTTTWADVGVLTMTEFVENAGRISRSTSLPVFCDADTGGGSAVNVWRTVQEFINAGVAGIHLEDQADPKLTGDRLGKRLLDLDEAMGKLQAAMDARDELDRNFVICGRTDARTAMGGSIEEALRRGKAFASLGVDMVLYAELMSWEECVYAIKETPAPTCCIIDPKGGVLPSIEEQQRAKHAIAIYPRVITNAANRAGWHALMDFRERGQASLDESDAAARTDKWRFDMESLLNFSYARVRRMEEKYYPARMQRDYGDEK
jgi:2-methylisocitrate lyase-like PEP mutase family enzyme